MGYGTSIGENYVLVGGLEHVFPFFGNFIIPTDELIFFRGVETANQNMSFYCNSIKYKCYMSCGWVNGVANNPAGITFGDILQTHIRLSRVLTSPSQQTLVLVGE